MMNEETFWRTRYEMLRDALATDMPSHNDEVISYWVREVLDRDAAYGREHAGLFDAKQV